MNLHNIFEVLKGKKEDGKLTFTNRIIVDKDEMEEGDPCSLEVEEFVPLSPQ